MFEMFKYKTRKFFLGIRYKLILWLIGNMSVITNCLIYDDVIEYNFGKTRTYKPCVCFNNKVRRLDRVIDEEIAKRKVPSDKNIMRKKDSFVFNPIFGCIKEN